MKTLLKDEPNDLTRTEIEAADGPYQLPAKMLALARRIAEVSFDEKTGHDDYSLLNDDEIDTLQLISERLYRDARIMRRAFAAIGIDTTTREERKRWLKNERESKKDYEKLLAENETLKQLQVEEKIALVKTLADNLGMKVIRNSEKMEGSTQKKNGKDLSQSLSVH